MCFLCNFVTAEIAGRYYWDSVTQTILCCCCGSSVSILTGQTGKFDWFEVFEGGSVSRFNECDRSITIIFFHFECI